MTGIPEFFVDDAPDAETDPPLEFKVTYTVAGEKTSEVFRAVPKSQVPYAWTLDYFAAGLGDLSAQAAATIEFLDRVLAADDVPRDEPANSSKTRFHALVHDPAVAVNAKTLQAIVVHLIETYNGLDPTRARSAGSGRSRSGRSKTTRGSTATRSAKATS